MDPVGPSPGKEKDPPSNTASAGSVPKSSESHGVVLSSSTTPSWSLGRPRSRMPLEGMISSQDGTLCPPDQYRTGDRSQGGPGVKGLLGARPSSVQQSIPTFLPPKKRVLKSPQLHGHSLNGPHTSSMQYGKTPQIQPNKTSTPQPPSPAKTESISQTMIAKLAQPRSENPVVDAGMRAHNNSGQSLKMTQHQVNKSPAQSSISSPSNTGLGIQLKTTPAQCPHKDSDADVSMRQSNNSGKPVKMPQIQPNKTSATSSLSSLQNTGLRTHATNTMSARPPLKDSADGVSMRPNDNYTSQPVIMPELRSKKSPGPPSLSPPSTWLRANVTTEASVQPRIECSNVDVSRRKRDGQDNSLSTLMSGWKSARKRLHGSNTLPIVEEVGNVTTKKTRLDWGEGLAKYEREKREQGLINTPAIGVNGDLSNSSNKKTETVACPDSVSAFSCGSRSSHGGKSSTGDLGSCSLPSVIGAKGALENNSSSVTEKAVCHAASGCNTPQGAKCDILSTSKNTTEVMACPGDLSDSSTRTTEKVAGPDIVPAIGDLGSSSPPSVIGANSHLGGNSSSITEMVVCPAASRCNLPQAQEDHGNSTTEKVVYPAANGSTPPQVVGVSGDDPDNPCTKMAETNACQAALPSSYGHNASQGAKSDIPTTSTCTTEDMDCSDDVPSFTPVRSPPQAGNFGTSVPHKLTAQGSDKIECSSAPPRGIVLAGEILAPPHKGSSSIITTSNPHFILTFPKIEGSELRNFSGNRYSNKEVERDEQELKSRTNDISACKDSTNCITQSGTILLDGEESQTAINEDSGDGGSTEVGKQDSSGKENPERQNPKMQAKENPKSDKKCGILNNGSELGDNGLVQQHNGMEAMEIHTNDNDNNNGRDEGNRQHSVAAREISGAALSCTIESMDVEKHNTILIPAQNEIIEPQQLISYEAPRICQSSSTSCPALQTVNAKPSDAKFDVDLNIPFDVALVNVNTSNGGASVDFNTSSQISQIDLNIPDPASMDDVPNDGGPANSNLGAKVEMAHDFIHVQNYLQSQTKMPEITKDVNQPGCFMLFGKVIFQGSSSQTTHTSMQDNQIHRSRDMASNMTVPITAGDGRSYPSGPWNTWSSVPSYLYHQSVFSNQMPYRSVSGSAALPFQSMRSAFVHWRQMPHLNMTHHNMMRGGVPYHMTPGSRSSSILNFDPCLPDISRPQAPGPVTPSRTNGEGSSTRKTRKGKEKIA